MENKKESQAQGQNELIGMEFILEILKTSCYTPAIKDGIPLSIMLIGPPGAGKSKVLLKMKSAQIVQCDDMTSAGLIRILERDPEGKLSHILLPDFNTVLSHKKSVSTLTITSLLGLLSDGVMSVADGRANKEVKHKPMGVLGAMTRDMWDRNAKKWEGLGLSRRFIPIHYTYCPETINKIQESIKQGKTTLAQSAPIQIESLTKQFKVEIPKKIQEDLKSLSTLATLTLSMGPVWHRDGMGGISVEAGQIVKNKLPFSAHLALQTMCKAHALMSRRTAVNTKDWEFICQLSKYFDYSAPVQL